MDNRGRAAPCSKSILGFRRTHDMSWSAAYLYEYGGGGGAARRR